MDNKEEMSRKGKGSEEEMGGGKRRVHDSHTHTLDDKEEGSRKRKKDKEEICRQRKMDMEEGKNRKMDEEEEMGGKGKRLYDFLNDKEEMGRKREMDEEEEMGSKLKRLVPERKDLLSLTLSPPSAKPFSPPSAKPFSPPSATPLSPQSATPLSPPSATQLTQPPPPQPELPPTPLPKPLQIPLCPPPPTLYPFQVFFSSSVLDPSSTLVTSPSTSNLVTNPSTTTLVTSSSTSTTLVPVPSTSTPSSTSATSLPGSRRRRNLTQVPRGGRSETIIPPFPWATNRRATVYSLKHLLQNGLTKISGKAQCRKCEKTIDMIFDLPTKFFEVASYIAVNKSKMHDRAPKDWLVPPLPKCNYCQQDNSLRPIIARKKKDINWLFLFLGQLLGCCTLEQLKYFCKHTRNHRTGAKDRVLYLTYVHLVKQLNDSDT